MKNSRNYLVVFIMLLSFGACKTMEKTDAPAETATSVKITEPLKIDLSAVKFDTTGKVMRENFADDSLFMNLTRTPCYGQCPVFTADIYKSGFVVYNGKRFVDKEGAHTARMSPDDLASIRKMVFSIKYFDLESEYDSPVTDLPTTYTTANIKGQKKTIKNRVGGPDELRALEKHVQRILDSLTWTASGNSGK